MDHLPKQQKLSTRQKVFVVFGTRPEAIKVAPVIKALEHQPSIFETRVCVTGQHRQMLDQVLDIFAIKPDYDLAIMKPNQDLFDVTSSVLLGLRDVLAHERPDWLLVQGDTTTTVAASLAAFYCGIKVGHIEAGLRSHNKSLPFPEEVNRRISDVLSDLYFVPTKQSKDNLLREGISPESILVTGNTVIDALLWLTANKLRHGPEQLDELADIDWNKRMILVTGHRRESFGNDFRSICHALLIIAKLYPDVNIVYPVHLNPNIQGTVTQLLSRVPNVYLIAPQDYERFVWLMTRAYLILTDSGGVQEEAPALNKPVLVMRRVTERTEGIEAGTAKLIGVGTEAIVENVKWLLEDDTEYNKMAAAPNPYGDGMASGRIVEALQTSV